MNALKKMLVLAVVAASTTLAGCNSLKEVTDRGHALYDANPAAYEAMTGAKDYMSVNPQFNVHGS